VSSESVLRIRRMLAGIVALASWACSGSTQPDATPQVADIVVNPSAVTLSLNAQQPLQALVRNAAGELVPDASVTWTAENAAIATVSPTGVVTAVGLGSTQIAASARGKSGIATVTVQRTPVASVVVVPNVVNAGIGGTTQLIAKAYDAGQNELSGRDMVWTTSNAAVATVDGNGLVTAKAKGTATITATTEGKSGTSQFTISPGAVSKVTVTPSSISMVTGQTQPLAATAQDASGTVLSDRTAIWSSDNTQVATVSGGNVTAVGRGSAKISATVDGVSGSASVTVANAPVKSVTVAPASVVVGSKVQLSATVTDTRNVVVTDRVVTWSMPNNPYASINANTGEVTGLSAGTVTATAKSEGKSGSATVTVTNAPVASVTVAPVTIVAGSKAKLTATVKDTRGVVVTDRAVTWSMPTNLVAVINASTGEVTALLPGTVTATATSEGKSGSATVTVTLAPVKSVTVAPSDPTVDVGKTQQFSATVVDVTDKETDRPVTWSSSNPQVASIDANTGLATVLAAGTTTITAKSDGVEGSTTLTAVPVVASVSVAPPSQSIEQNTSITLTATVKDGAGNALAGQPVTWTTSDATVASLSATTGESVVVTGGLVGEATITATSSGQSGTSTITVTDAPVASVVVRLGAAEIKRNESTTAVAVAYDANQSPLQGRDVSWFAVGAATVSPSISTTSAGEDSAANATVKGKGKSPTTSAIISATVSGRSGSASLTVSQ
jgi:trimeric autotransporter adhesin